MDDSRDRYLRDRVENQRCWYEGKANKAKRWHEWTQMALALLTAAIPVSQLMPVSSLLQRVSAAALGAAAFVVQRLRDTKKYHENWLNFRAAEQFLMSERWTFEMKVGTYNGVPENDAEDMFVTNIEAFLKGEHNIFQDIATATKDKTKVGRE